MAEKISWVVVWFPPDKPKREVAVNTRESAEEYVAQDHVASWAPLILKRTTTVTDELVWNSAGGKI